MLGAGATVMTGVWTVGIADLARAHYVKPGLRGRWIDKWAGQGSNLRPWD
jgi:hypothetical protein